jgi:hypothetical protein
MAITKEQWLDIEDALSGIVGNVTLKVDDDAITIQRRFVGKDRLGIVVYINDEIRGEHYIKPTDLVKKVWFCKKRSVYSAKQKAIFKKCSKKDRATLGISDIDEKSVYYSPFFSSFSRLKSQYSKLDNIEVVSIQGISIQGRC